MVGKGVFGVASFLLSAAAFAQDTVEVTAPALNVRAGPGTGYVVTGEVAAGQTYVRVSTSGSWFRIWYGPGAGWVHSAYVTTTGAAKAKVTTGSLNVRTGPGTGYDIVGAVGSGSWWAILASSGPWQKIWFAGAERWVHGAYLSTSLSNPEGLPASAAGFVQLPASGNGFYSYTTAGRRWGTPAMVYGLMDVAASWTAQHDWPALGIGDISLKQGGTISGHVSHKVGKDVDILPVRVDTTGGTVVGSATYSQARTKDLITHHIKPLMGVKLIFFNDPAIYEPLSYVQYWENHYNHMHVRIY